MRRRRYIQAMGGCGVGIALTNSVSADNIKRKIKLNGYRISSDKISAEIWMDNNKVSKESTAEVNLEFTNSTDDIVTISRTYSNSVNSIIGTRETGTIELVLVGKMNTWENENGRWFADEDDLNPDRPDRTESVDLAEGETYRMQFEVWSHHGSPYIPPGTYNFARSIDIEGNDELLNMSIEVTNN